MSASSVSETIQLIIAPVVLITACGLIESGILGRYTSLGQRIRSLTHERLDLLSSGKEKEYFWMERMQEIDRQIPLLIQRHQLLQNASLLIYSSISVFIFSMFAIAIAVTSNLSVIATLSLFLFMLGTMVLCLGVFFVTQEIRISHQAICYETHRVLSLYPSSMSVK